MLFHTCEKRLTHFSLREMQRDYVNTTFLIYQTGKIQSDKNEVQATYTLSHTLHVEA